MSTQKEVTLYSFSELSENVKAKLIYEFDIDSSWDHPIIEMIEQEAEEMGIEDFDLRYSGFWSQGDGLSFTGTLSEDLVEKIYKEKVNRDGFGEENPAFTVSFYRSNNMYCHEKTVSASVEGCFEEEDNRFFEGVFNEWKDAQCQYWYNILKECYEIQTSEDFIEEHYKDCGEIFLSDGRIL